MRRRYFFKDADGREFYVDAHTFDEAATFFIAMPGGSDINFTYSCDPDCESCGGVGEVEYEFAGETVVAACHCQGK